eukprot:augustus_masked-scaffold_12-processed-gene-6.57-mRNA-1 protein AED:0.11 eAED:0.11 QI:0/0/0/1/1/1/2/0/530
MYCDSIAIPTLGGNGERGILLITDAFTKFRMLYIYKQKGKIPKMLIYMVKRIQKESNLQLSILYMDEGTEFRDELVENFCFSTGIEPRYAPTNTPQLNGLAERSNRTLLVKVRILLEQAQLPHLYWPQAANFATVLLNRTPSKTQLKSPYELIFKVNPTLENIFIFGQRVVYIYPEVKSKVHTPGRKAKHLGPAKHSAESYLLDDTSKNIVTTRNFKDLNNIDLLRNRKKRENPLRDVRIERNLESMEKELSAREQFLHIRNEATVEKPRHWVRRSTRKTTKPKNYKKTKIFYLAEEARALKIPTNDVFLLKQYQQASVPKSFFQIRYRNDKQHWYSAYEKEYNKFTSIAECKEVPRTEIPPEVKPFRFIEIFEVKKDNVTHQKKYKVRFAANAYDLKQTTTTEKFVGYEIEKVSDVTHIGLEEYIEELNQNYETGNIAQKINTPYIPNECLYKEEDGVLDPALYQSIIGSLTYVSETIRPDIAFGVNRLAIFGNCPTKKHLNAAIRVLRYLSQTKDLGTMIKSFGKNFA